MYFVILFFFTVAVRTIAHEFNQAVIDAGNERGKENPAPIYTEENIEEVCKTLLQKINRLSNRRTMNFRAAQLQAYHYSVSGKIFSTKFLRKKPDCEYE